MADGNGECCIARWGEGHVADYNNSSKMNMIMLKFRPIAPKPIEGSASTATENNNNNSTRHAKTTGRGRKKSRPKDNNNNNNNNNNNSGSGSSSGSRRRKNNGRKRKSTSPDHHQKPCTEDHKRNDETNGHDDQRADLTLLPLFPEEPDLMNNQVHNLLPFYSLSFDETDKTAPAFVGNYGNCHQSWW